MQTVGHYLKQERETKKITLDEVFRTTRIPIRYLDSIEQDDFEKMPGDPYNKGYISSYASFIGVDKNEALKLYNALRLKNKNDKPALNKLSNAKEKGTHSASFFSRIVTIILSLIVLMLAALAAYYFLLLT